MTSASAIDGTIQEKMRGRGVLRSGKGITLVISNEDMDDIIRSMKSLEDWGKLIDGVSKRVTPDGLFLGILLGTLGSSMLGNKLTGKGFIRKSFSSATSSKQYQNY